MEGKELPLGAGVVPLPQNPIMKGFLHGQYANLFKFAVWWTTLAPLSFALMDKDSEAIGVARIVYNVALCLLSPLGGILVERVHPRKILKSAAGARFLLWCVMVPLSWFIFDSSIVADCQSCMYILFNVAMFFDGGVVALSAILDIDLAGVDVVAGRYGLEVTDDDRNYFNSRQELCFALCFIILAPGTAFLGLAFKNAFEDGKDDVRLTEGGTLIAVFGAVFLAGTVLQFFFFRQLPDETLSSPELDSVAVTDANGNGDPAVAFWDQVKGIPMDLLGSLKVIWSSKPILFRLIFLGLEIAFEDAAIVIIAAQMGIFLPWLGDDNAVWGNIWTSLGVASGKLGGAIASVLMMKFFKPPEHVRSFVVVFILIFISSIVILAFPATVEAHDSGHISDNAARGLYLSAFFLYFFFSTLPKLGLMCLFQSMISQIENGPRVFGFVAIIAMSFDALVVMALSILFNHYEFKHALWITAFVYLGHGVLELIFGPLLVLMPLQAALEVDAGDDLAPTDDTASMASKYDSVGASAQPAAVCSERRPSGLGIPEGSFRGRASRVSRLDGAGDGYYTQRSAAVEVSNSSALPNSMAADGDRFLEAGGSFVAVLSVSKNFAYGSLARRRSALTSTLRDREGDGAQQQSTSDNNARGSVGSPHHLVPVSNESNLLLSVGSISSPTYLRKGSSLLPPTRPRKSNALN